MTTPERTNDESTTEAGRVASRGPSLEFSCDLVMKGGITSGVVYPPTIVELAKDHRFYNIGGSSAGAIAAVVAAAAEFGRQNGDDGFEILAKIPDELASTDPSTGRTKLRSLFVPQPGTRKYFDLIWQQLSMESASIFRRVLSILEVGFKHGPARPSFPILGVSVGLPLVAIVAVALNPSFGTVAFMGLAVPIGIGAYLLNRAGSGIHRLVIDAPKQLSSNMHGLCNGASVDRRVGLTEWLHRKVQELAGRAEYKPLTYGDLEGAEIGLVTMTTNLSQNSSETFPFSDETWAFRPGDIETLFPDSVARHLVDAGREATKSSSRRELLEAQGLLKLPMAKNLPVILGARISLSYPVLLAAVPLWRIAPVRQEDGSWLMRYCQVWLSDGGICSNLPVHLFDNPLPCRPTYGINLASGTTGPVPDAKDEATQMRHAHDNVWRPVRTGSGSQPPVGSIDSTLGLLVEVLNTMQNWSDNTMLHALGVRDRICTIRLDSSEGGMNLDMNSKTIQNLAPRGRAAGENLGWIVRGNRPAHAVGETGDEHAAQWTRHRWTRLRSSVRGLDKYLVDLATQRSKLAVPQSGDLHANEYSFDDLAHKAHDLRFLPYRSKWNDTAARSLIQAMDALNKIDFAEANKRSTPPLRKLVLSTRADPETDLE